MRDAVALAWSGRVEEAWAAARAQAASEDPFYVAQGLEALAVLGEAHGLRADPEVDALLLANAGAQSRRTFEAARALGSEVLEEEAAERLRAGRAGWEVLRYAAELPSLKLARALAEGWDHIDGELRDEALLCSASMPVASREEERAWGERALAARRDPSPEVRRAALLALQIWRPEEATQAALEGLLDGVETVRAAAAQTLTALRWEADARLIEAWAWEAPERRALLEKVRPEW